MEVIISLEQAFPGSQTGMVPSDDWSGDYRQQLRGHQELRGLPVQPEGEQNRRAPCLQMSVGGDEGLREAGAKAIYS